MKKLSPFLLVLLLLLFGHVNSFSQNDKGGFLFTTSSNQALSAFQAGLRFNDLGEGKKAREYFQQAIAQDPKFVIAYIYLAFYSQSPQEFVTNLNKAKENLAGANDWEKLMYEFAETDLTNDMDKRLMVAQKMVGQFPDNARAYIQLGETYDARNDFAKARESYQKAIALDATWPGGYIALANSFLFSEPKDFKQAEITASKLVAIASTGSTYILLGDTYRAQNNLAKAEEMYSKAVELDASSPAGFYKRGHCRSFTGQYDKARADYETAGKLDVTPVGARNMIAFTFLYQGQPDKALESLLTDAETITQSMDAAKATAAKSNLFYTAALIAAHTRNAQKLQQIVDMLKPISEEIANAVGTEEAKLNGKADMLFWEGIVKVLNNDLTGATQTAEEMKMLLEPIKNPRKLEGYEFLLGCTSMKQKDFTTAIAHFEKTSPINVYDRYCLAKAYEAGGQKDKAMAIYKELANYNFNNIGYALIRNEVKGKM